MWILLKDIRAWSLENFSPMLWTVSVSFWVMEGGCIVQALPQMLSSPAGVVLWVMGSGKPGEWRPGQRRLVGIWSTLTHHRGALSILIVSFSWSSSTNCADRTHAKHLGKRAADFCVCANHYICFIFSSFVRERERKCETKPFEIRLQATPPLFLKKHL